MGLTATDKRLGGSLGAEAVWLACCEPLRVCAALAPCLRPKIRRVHRSAQRLIGIARHERSGRNSDKSRVNIAVTFNTNGGGSVGRRGGDLFI